MDGDHAATRVYYLSTAPRFYEPAIAQLGAAELAGQPCRKCRVVIEKPFGTDLATARHLNEAVHEVFRERQVYRIDHYLGKETVANLLVLRFANTIFEPVWNRNYIDHVQITAAEEVTVGRRADYYESAGVLRDMFQNHLLQLLTSDGDGGPGPFRGRRRPRRKGQGAPRDPPMKPEEVVAADTIRGQYRRYRDEPGVPARQRDGHLRRGQAARSTTGAGRACRSTCAAARPCPAGPRRS